MRRAAATLVTATLLAAVVPAQRVRAAEPAEEPRFRIQVDHVGRGDGFSFESTTTTSYRLCDVWDGGRRGVVATGDLGLGRSVGRGLPGMQATGTPRQLFALRRSLLGLEVGEALPFCTERSHGSGRDGHGSVVTSDTDERGTSRTRGVLLGGAQPSPFETSSPAGDDPGRNARAELFRTAGGARLTFSPGNGESAEDTDIGIIEVSTLSLPPSERRKLTSFELTERELSGWSRLTRSATVAGQAEVGHLTISLRLAVEQPDLGEVLVEAEGYDRWRPQGSLADATAPGAELVVTARVHATGDASRPSDKQVQLTFELKGASTQRGVCNNWPAEGADTRPDLRLLEARNPGLDVPDETTASTRGPVGEARLVVSSFDYGAWGRLLVTALDAEGRAVPVTVKGREGKVGAALLIPRDDDENRIADAWQEQRGVLGRLGTDDADELPVGNGFPGDGLTLYEEYRGFQVQGEWIETDPRRKDLFVCDRTGFAREGLALFEAASGLTVHQVTSWELGADKVINRHFSAGAHLVDQHGLLIEAGGTSPINEGDEFGPPRTSTRILLPAAPAGDPHRRQEMISDIAHEVAHGVGLQHHGEGLKAVLFRRARAGDREVLTRQALVGDSDGAIAPDPAYPPTHVRILREADGAEVLPGPATPGFQWDARLGGYLTYEAHPGGETSGDDTCLMRYGEKGVYLSRADPGSVRYLPDGPGWRARTSLCGSAAGTGVNAPGHAPQPRAGAATHGDCRRQLVVSDRYRPPPGQ